MIENITNKTKSHHSCLCKYFETEIYFLGKESFECIQPHRLPFLRSVEILTTSTAWNLHGIGNHYSFLYGDMGRRRFLGIREPRRLRSWTIQGTSTIDFQTKNYLRTMCIRGTSCWLRVFVATTTRTLYSFSHSYLEFSLDQSMTPEKLLRVIQFYWLVLTLTKLIIIV